MMEAVRLIQTEFEDRSPLYEDVRSLLSPGFLTEVVVLQGHRFALRSFSSEDFFLLRCRTGPEAPDHEAKAWALASSIWMVDGQIIHNHQEGLLRVHKMCLELTHPVRDALYRQLAILIRRMQEASLRIEAYLYETESRFLWRGEGGKILTHSPISVGINRIQHLWSFFNTVEDLREHNQYLWSLTKFVAGTQAPKGIQKLTVKEQKQEAALEYKRQRIRDRMYYEAMGIPFPTEEESRRYLNVNPMETEADLKKEYARWISGEKDWHDKIIDYVKNKIRREHEQRLGDEVHRGRELEQILEEEQEIPASMEVLSPELAKQFMQRSREPKRVVQDSTHNSAYEKYLAQDPVPGYMDVNDGVPRPKEAPTPEMLAHLRSRVLDAPIEDDSSEDSDGELRQYLDNHPPTVKG